MAMTLTVRRRAVCALALLALLCGCCAPSVCVTAAAAAEVKVPVSVEVSCPDTNGKLSWRVADKSNSAAWNTCPTTPEDLCGSESAAGSNSLCIFAGSVFLEKFATGGCSPSTTDGDTNKVVAFTMNCTVAPNSALHNLSKSEGGTITEAE
ncbi:mucin-like glycoprotein, partial [Trypanosoma conorhini]